MKLAVEADALIPLLKKAGAERIRIEEQCDRYFRHPVRDFSVTDEALRVRKRGTTVELTYKGPKRGDSGKVRLELNCGVESAGDMNGILDALGFGAAGTVRKTREKWRLGAIEIALDRVEGLGDFMEAELVVDEDHSDGALKSISKAVESLGLNPLLEIRKSYLELLLERNT